MDADDRVGRERGLRAAVLAGDERAWQAWYEQSFDGLNAYVCWRCGGRREAAEDVVQETWLTAVRRIRVFEPERGSFAHWLRGIAANILRNRFRRQHAARHASLNGQQLETGCDARSDESEGIAAALAALPEHYEAVLRSKYLDEQSVAEIADARGETPKAVESLLTRARQAFREAFARME